MVGKASRSRRQVSNVGAKRKISPDLEREILKRSASGLTGPEIVAWLLAEHGIKVTRQSINVLIRETRQERSEVAKAVTREALTGHVVSDLDILKRSLQRVERLERRLHVKANRLLTIADKAIKGEAGSDGEPMSIDLVVMASEGANDAAAIALKASAEVRAQVDTKLGFAGAKEESSAVTHSVDVSKLTDADLERLTGVGAASSAGKGRA